jgi:hypothetical protein
MERAILQLAFHVMWLQVASGRESARSYFINKLRRTYFNDNKPFSFSREVL